ncbi:MAG: DUF4124 domain-containing protein [Burkholderiales bacterium]|nr:DUF4124 domain-containing protein [Burkholderiales bacterium]
MKPIRPLICLALCLYALTASAQWQWMDKDGRKVFSDRAPPSDIPEKNILKRPGSRGSSAPVAAPAAAAPMAAPVAGVDKSLQEKKKQVEDAEAAKRKADEERNARAMADTCSRAQQAKSGLDSGARMARTNEKGEREFMDEAARAAEGERLQGIINENCK